MADYWKSQDRKYCDFCKCWIADNKPSVEFHEKGRRHIENVKKRLRNIQKNSARAEREAQKEDAALRQMEAAALEAYKKDVENNADLTSLAINQKLKDENLAIGSTSKKVWQELQSPDGKTYYWNTVTSESSWEVPKEGYMSIAEQQQQRDSQMRDHYKSVAKYNDRQDRLKVQQQEQDDAEEKARLAREKMKERRVADSPPPVTHGPELEPEPVGPYGRWEPVVRSEEPSIDWQLPTQPTIPESTPIEYEPEPAVKEFKEKTVTNLFIGGEATFKKKKIVKRNTRQRLDDD